jgi:hypothetical protein
VLNTQLHRLENSILSAQLHADVDVYRIASQRFDELMEEVECLPIDEAWLMEERVYELLPSDWVLWMEVCRYVSAPDDPARLLH